MVPKPSLQPTKVAPDSGLLQIYESGSAQEMTPLKVYLESDIRIANLGCFPKLELWFQWVGTTLATMGGGQCGPFFVCGEFASKKTKRKRVAGADELVLRVDDRMVAGVHPNLCKLLGYHARDVSEQRMLVYERSFHGSSDRLLYGRSDGPPLDWNTRMKIALCSAQGLTFLHEEGPSQRRMRSPVIQLLWQIFLWRLWREDDQLRREMFGVSELFYSNYSLAGRTFNRHPKEERNLVKWSRPFLADDYRLSLIMDPQLKGRFPMKAARTVAGIAQRCLQMDPLERPTMRTIVEHLKIIQDMKYSCRFPLQDPAAIAGKQMSRSPSLNGIITPAPRSSFSSSPPSGARMSFSPTRPPNLPSTLPRMHVPPPCH
ncbi:putative transcription factor [Hibiscus syriacus]|uniref:Transcription factor n=1 Tax=Hibiscus syriacus TaxID=106335 RepID=A0A6A2WS19_HIBSY|nr:putative transcription factor [Hibiscus syriacus]